MSRSDQRFDYAAPAVLHENVPGGPIVTGVQTWRGGPIAEGTLADMIRMGIALPMSRAVHTSITVDAHTSAAGDTLLKYSQYCEIADRADFPR